MINCWLEDRAGVCPSMGKPRCKLVPYGTLRERVLKDGQRLLLGIFFWGGELGGVDERIGEG
jgi:hypothetical protein